VTKAVDKAIDMDAGSAEDEVSTSAKDVTKAVDKAIDMDAGSAEDEASGNADTDGNSEVAYNQHSASHSQAEQVVEAPRIQIAHVPKVAKLVRDLVEKIEGATADQTLQNQHHANHQLPSFSKQGHPEVHVPVTRPESETSPATMQSVLVRRTPNDVEGRDEQIEQR